MNRSKRFLILSVSCFLLAFLLGAVWFQRRDEALAARIAPEILRFHVLANSDSAEDQNLKLEVRNLILNSVYDGLGENATKETTSSYIEEHSADLENLAKLYMKGKGFDYSARVELTECYFPTKAYGDMVFPCGTYDAARVIIGEGKGRNWWCVLYPQLCFVDATYAVVPDSSRETLERALGESDYMALLDCPEQPYERKIKFKFLEMLSR